VKETDDGEKVDVLDVGSIPTTSTKHPETWAEKPERVVPGGLVGMNVHGVKTKPHDWYYTQREWDRTVGIGRVPPERDSLLQKEHGGDKVSTRRIEISQEDSDT